MTLVFRSLEEGCPSAMNATNPSNIRTSLAANWKHSIVLQELLRMLLEIIQSPLAGINPGNWTNGHLA
jgi:hypothetical protein